MPDYKNPVQKNLPFKEWKLVAALIGLSLAPRLITLIAFAHYDTPPVYDEGGYFLRAQGAADTFTSLLTLDHAGLRSGLYSWFGWGKWPPLYPWLLSLGMPFFEDNVVGARCVNVLLSSLTTWVVYCLASRIAMNRAVAVIAAGLHALHPTLIAYAVLLWSETAYTLFLMLCILFMVQAMQAKELRKRRSHYLLASAALAATGLIRAASLPLFVIVPVLVAWLELRRNHPAPYRLAAGMAATVLVIILPYQAVLCGVHKKIVLLSTASDYNLYLGNNPWVPLENGSSWGDNPSKAKVHRAMATGDVAGRLAREEIAAHPMRFVARSAFRLRMLWSPDFFPLRHVLSAAAPPTYPWGVALLTCGTLLAFVFVLGWGLFGLLAVDQFHWGAKTIAWGMCVGLTIGPVVTIAMSRLHFSMTVILLPFAAAGVLAMSSRMGFRQLACGVGSGAFVLFALSSIPVVVGQHLLPSSYYAHLLTPVAERLNRTVEYRDVIAIRVPDDAGPTNFDLTLTISNCHASLLTPYDAQAAWEGKKQASQRAFDNAGIEKVRLRPGQETEVILVGSGSDDSFDVLISTSDKEAKATLAPRCWKRGCDAAIPGVVYQWN
ncbi:MAG: glycosyltransferase family 39 protein [Planctomycetales bacterium]|nr:glycosyltransferase family 39 protein [Planctomycetales bacterium]